MENRNSWVADFRKRLGIPDSRRVPVARALIAWWQTEGGATYGKPWHGAETDWNPLNTTQKMPGSHDQPGNHVPVQVYANRESGMDATIKTITNGLYSKIVHRMTYDGFSAHSICQAIYLSKWGTGTLIFEVLDDITMRGLYWDYAGITVYPS